MVGGKGAGVVAFDAKTGKTAWKATDDPASYAVAGRRERSRLVFLTGSDLLGLSTTGEKLWACPFKEVGSTRSSTTPVKVGDLVIGSSVTAGSVALQADEDRTASRHREGVGEQGADVLLLDAGGGRRAPVHGQRRGDAHEPVDHAAVRRAGDRQGAWEKENVGKYHAAIVRTGEPRTSCSCSTTPGPDALRAGPEGVQGAGPGEGVRPDLGPPGARGRPVFPARRENLICVPLK